jgi:hypothetical protein
MPQSNNWWFKFEFNRWRNDSSLRKCSLETKGFWIECICAMREADTDRITGTVDQIARLIGCFPDETRRCLAELESTGTADLETCNGACNGKCNGDVTLCNGKVTLLSRYIKNELKDRENLRLRVERHRKNKSSNGDVTLHSKSKSKSNSKNTLKDSAVESPEIVHTAPTETAVSPPPQKRKIGTRIPDQFFITQPMKDWAADKELNIDLRLETEKFVNYWRAKAGKDATKIDWAATWRNWMLNAQERAGGFYANGQQPPQRPTSEREKSAQRRINGNNIADALERQALDEIARRNALPGPDHSHLEQNN